MNTILCVITANPSLYGPKNAKFILICAEEAYFYLTLPLNEQNNRIWSDSRPLEGTTVPLHDQKVFVWCAISANFGP